MGGIKTKTGTIPPTPWRAHTRGKITLTLVSPTQPAGPERRKRTRLTFSGLASSAESAVKLAAPVRIELLHLTGRALPVLCAADSF